MKYCLRYALIFAFSLIPLNLSAKKFKAMHQGEQVLLLEYDPEEKKSEKFVEIEEILSKHLDGEFVLARVEDIFPYDISDKKKESLTRKSQADLRNYYNYVRSDLEHLSGGKTLKYIKKDFDLDGNYDYAVVAVNKKNHEKSFVIVNEKKLLFKDSFERTYLELVNGGKYPLDLDTGRSFEKVNSPCLRLRSFDGKQDFVYFDRHKKDWVKISFDAE